MVHNLHLWLIRRYIFGLVRINTSIMQTFFDVKMQNSLHSVLCKPGSKNNNTNRGQSGLCFEMQWIILDVFLPPPAWQCWRGPVFWGWQSLGRPSPEVPGFWAAPPGRLWALLAVDDLQSRQTHLNGMIHQLMVIFDKDQLYNWYNRKYFSSGLQKVIKLRNKTFKHPSSQMPQ